MEEGSSGDDGGNGLCGPRSEWKYDETAARRTAKKMKTKIVWKIRPMAFVTELDGSSS